METLNDQLANAFKAACLQELEALKPGNVHVFADGHNMTVQDFIISAEVVFKVIALPDLTLGQRILKSVQATNEAVGCNTNLGIILLCGPLIHAALIKNEQTFEHNLKAVLASTSIADAQNVFAAIKLANPAGLGKSEKYDVHHQPNCTLQQAMQFAAHRDLIAQQYTNNFADILNVGVRAYQHAFNRLQNSAWATSELYLTLLSQYIDSHIVKKNSEQIAKDTMNEAKKHLNQFKNMKNPKLYLSKLLAWDTELKAKGINPGTTADMTVASILLINFKLDHLSFSN